MDQSAKNLTSFGYNVTSEHGEDGVIKRIFEIIGTKNKSCLELGALNGTHGSNVWSLIKKEGWFGVLVEADHTYFEKLKKEFSDNPKAICLNAFVSFEGSQSLDSLLSNTPLPKDFDLFSLDIDGNEYHLWESLTLYRPRVMIVEFNPTIPNDISFIQPRDMSVQQGSSLRALNELAKKKGYELVAANDVNAFFVVRELFPNFGIADNSLDALHTSHSFETKIFQLYDGTLKIAGNKKLIWHNLPITEEKLQILPKRKRFYPAKISPSSAVRKFKQLIRKMPFYDLFQRFRKSIL